MTLKDSLLFLNLLMIYTPKVENTFQSLMLVLLIVPMQIIQNLMKLWKKDFLQRLTMSLSLVKFGQMMLLTQITLILTQ
jgi:hypothetical protein